MTSSCDMLALVDTVTEKLSGFIRHLSDGLYIFYSKSLIRHLGLVIGNVGHVQWFSWTLGWDNNLQCCWKTGGQIRPIKTNELHGRPRVWPILWLLNFKKKKCLMFNNCLVWKSERDLWSGSCFDLLSKMVPGCTTQLSGACLNIKMPFYQYRDSHHKDKMVLQPYYFSNGPLFTKLYEVLSQDLMKSWSWEIVSWSTPIWAACHISKQLKTFEYLYHAFEVSQDLRIKSHIA